MPAPRSERYLVVLHVDEATVDAERVPGRSELDDGTRGAAETARRIACDASVVRVVHGPDGSITHVEGRSRQVPLRLRRALGVHDRGCRFPGCGSRYTEAHHLLHWADGGATRLDNLILLRRTHHHLLHEGRFTLRPDPEQEGKPAFYSPKGVRIPEVPPRTLLDGRPIAAAITTGTSSCPPRWETDVPLDLYLRAMEALG